MRNEAIRVLIVGPNPDLHRSNLGPQVFLHHLFKSVETRTDIHVAQILFKPHGSEVTREEDNKIFIDDPPFLRTIFSLVWHRKKILAFARNFRPDVVDLHMPHRAGVLNGLDVPIVITVHELLPILLKHSLLPAVKKPIAPLYLRAWNAGLRRAKGAICLSAHDAEYLAAQYGIECHIMGVPRSEEFFLNKEEKPHVSALAIGAVTPRKGYHDLIKVASALRKSISDFRVQLIGENVHGGDRSYRQLLLDQISSSGLRECITLVGHVPHLQIPKYLKRASVFFHFARQESMPGAMVEAMASGTPIIAYDIPSSREIIRHGETGYLVPRGDVDGFAQRANEIYANPALARQMGSAAKRYALDHFSTLVVGPRYSSILRQVTSGEDGERTP